MISIIVPVYNTEKYIKECIKSVLCQTYTIWELLLIDDGSTDKSGDICEEYAQKDKRIKVIHQKNQGVSAARNTALDNATGDYIMFLDADDFWCESTALEKLILTATNHNVDLVRGEYKRINEQGRELSKNTLQCNNYSNKILDSYLFLEHIVKTDFFCVLSLFKTDKLKSIRFEVGRVFMEDMIFYLKVLTQQSVRCIYVPETLFYAYRQCNNSASNKTNILKLRDSLHAGLTAMNLYDKTNDLRLKKYLQQMCIDRYCSTLKWLAHDKYYNKHTQFISEYEVKRLRNEIIAWMKKNSIQIKKTILYLKPLQLVWIYRLRYILSKLKYSFLSKWNTQQ